MTAALNGLNERVDTVAAQVVSAEMAHRALHQSPAAFPETPEAMVPFRHSEALDLYPDQVFAILNQTPTVLAAIRAMAT